MVISNNCTSFIKIFLGKIFLLAFYFFHYFDFIYKLCHNSILQIFHSSITCFRHSTRPSIANSKATLPWPSQEIGRKSLSHSISLLPSLYVSVTIPILSTSYQDGSYSIIESILSLSSFIVITLNKFVFLITHIFCKFNSTSSSTNNGLFYFFSP